MKHMVRHLVCLATVAGLIFGAQAESAGELAVEPIPDQAFTGAAVGAGAEISTGTTDGQEVELCAYEPTPIDIGICSDATCYQCDLGGGVYLLGFTNVTVEAMTFAPFLPCRIEKMLIVGGGGAGGYNCGGGGGGGGVIYADNLSLKAEDRPVISSLMSVLVAPGALRTATDGVGANGGHTKVTFGETSYVAYGGGGGGYWPSGGTPRAAAVTGEIGSGGGVSNGGPGKYNVDKTCYNSEQGNHGGMNIGDLAGGGGGAGGVGETAAIVDNVRYAGKGGIGFSCAITGVPHLYGSGGSGGQGTADREAYEGGGIGGKQSPGTAGGNGTNGLGGGGGGGAGSRAGGGGGSGCFYLVVQVIDSGKAVASISDYNGVAVEGEAYSNELTVVTADAQVRWSRTSETGPFDLSVQPFYTTAGIYTNWCEITAAGKDALVLQGVVRLRPENGDYYVAPDGSDMVGLGDEAMPFATIKKALEWIRPGFAVRLAPGTYRESGLEIGQAVTLAGDNADLSRCVIDADKKGRALTLSHTGARLTGLTIKNGLASGGANVYMTVGVVSNCVLTGGNGNASENGGNVYMSGGWLVDSQILNGSARRGGGATVAGDGRVVRCLFKGNNVTDSGGGVSINGNGVVENSLVVGNTGNYGAGVQINSQNAWLVNSTVAGNNGTWNVFQENGGGRLANVVSYGKHYIKKGSIEYCGLTTEPSREGSGHTIEHNVTIDASVFEDTTSYRPKKGLALHGAGSNSRYAEHAVSETDYEGNLRRRGLRIDIGHVELPPKDGTTLFLL